MKVSARVKRTFTSKGKTVPAGSVIRLDAGHLDHLLDRGLVEVIDAQQILSDSLKEIDRAGGTWPANFFTDMDHKDKARLRHLVAEIEAATLAEDVDSLLAALAQYRTELLTHLN